MKRVVRGCGQHHLGVCWTERAERWLRPGRWIPPEYRHLTRRQIEELGNNELNRTRPVTW